ncbi:trigger factor [Treponema sp. J25]|uniref:trigger factor n=1 Tax=Treponema sp. J25 TaxID=2094121 RepID=UPI001047094A|nr:trigger factor [Treponema sp. J25]TCW60618.1 trigger factor [Treponema sp. J25]
MVVSREIEKKEHSQVQLTVKVAQEEVRKEYTDVLSYYAKNIQLPGFRKGKAPQDLVERKLGEAVKADAFGKLIEKALKEVLDAEDFPATDRPLPYSQPTLREVPEFSLEKDLSFSVTYDVFPTVTVGSYKGIEVEEPVVEITDEDIKTELETLRERNAFVIDKAEGSPIAANDVVTINYAEVNEGGEVIPGTEREDFVFTVGSGMNYYKIDDEILGMKKGESKTITKSYPEDFEFPELAGKTKTITVTITALKEKKLPDLDDEFAQDVDAKYTKLEDLKKDLKQKLEKNLEQRKRELKIQQILDKLLEASTIDLPESMIRLEEESRLRSVARRLNMSVDQLIQIYQANGKNLEELLNEWRPDVERNLKKQLIVDTLIKNLSITVSDEEVEQEIAKQAQEMNISLEEIKKYYDDTNKAYLKEDLQQQKLFDLLLGEVKVKKGKKQKYLDLMGQK